MADLRQLRAWNEALRIGELDPSVDREARLYVELEQPGRSAMDEIGAAIRLSIPYEGVHLVSGPRGSGKSTELLRLKSLLAKDGYRVVRFDVLDYVSEAQPLTVEIFLVVMGLATTEALVGADDGRTRFAERLRSWLATWRPTEASFDVSGAPGGVGATASVTFERVDDLRRELSGNPNFVDWLRDQLSFFLKDLKDRVDEHLRELSSEHGNGLPIVVIVDSLERVGTNPTTETVGVNTADLFVHHGDKLLFPGVHAVFTVPPVVPVLNPGFANNIAGGVLPHEISVPRVVEEGDVHHGVALDRFVEVVDRRMDDRQELVGDDGLHRIIRASGGHLDDLFNLLTRLINLTLARGAPTPVDDELVEDAVADVRATLAPRTEEQASVIRWVRTSGAHAQPPRDMVAQLAQLLSTHLVLHRRNDHDWYEVHPLTLEALDQSDAG